MRKLAKPTEQEINEGLQTVSFQIANEKVRQRGILKPSSAAGHANMEA